MTALWAHMDDTGVYPLELRSGEAEGWVRLPAGTSIEAAIAMMFVKGAWQARPAIAAPTITAAKAGWIVVYATPLEGAACDVVDRDLGWLDQVPSEGGALTFLLADAGRYQLEVTAPLPWLGRTDNVVLA